MMKLKYEVHMKINETLEHKRYLTGVVFMKPRIALNYPKESFDEN